MHRNRLLATVSVLSTFILTVPSIAQDTAPPAAETLADSPQPKDESQKDDPLRFTGRFTPDTLIDVLQNSETGKLPLPLQPEAQKQAAIGALKRIDMSAVVGQMQDYLTGDFPGRFVPDRDIIVAPVPEAKQVTIDLSDVGLDPYQGPQTQVLGFVVQNVTEGEFLTVAFRVIEKARQLLETNMGAVDRTADDHYKRKAMVAVEQIRAQQQALIADAKQREEIRKEVGQALGVYNPETGEFDGQPSWLKESRRFSYIINEQDGTFIDRLQPMVQKINHKMQVAGFVPPGPLDKPGIHFDSDLGDVEIVLPKPMMERFLEETDTLEQRMAEKLIISIEAVRLTDRDIVDGAVAARLNAQVRGVHDVQRFNTDGVIRQLGINSLLAVANQQLQVQTLQQVAAGSFPAGVAPITIDPPTLPPIRTTREATTVGSNFSVGADDIFFDGRQQTYGFSYVTPDGIEHTLGLDIVDSLREFWNRIERNLIVHKIKKVPTLTKFRVPVGPDTQTYEGLAALISQEDQQLIVATGTGAISQIDATAGTWLVINDFQIAPIPGSSTAMTDEELREITDRLLLTMWLRDPLTPVPYKIELLETTTRSELHTLLRQRFSEVEQLPVRDQRDARTYGQIFSERHEVTMDDARTEKKEKNSVISLTFYSSQGNIIQTPGSTQLGSANDLTSFTTELRPNDVTPISSFLTKSLESARGTSPLTGSRKGESNSEEKVMTHLLIRARFPTIEREKRDRDEGRFLGYFELPIGREPLSNVEVPFLSSSEHPLERLATFRVGALFNALREDKVRYRFDLLNPNILEGKVRPEVYESAMTRLMLNHKIIGDTPSNDATLGPRFSKRFITEVRSLLEYDPVFFDAPNAALRNMSQWNDPDRIVVALNNSAGKFALQRLIKIIDELGETLVPTDYAENYIAKSPFRFLAGHEVLPLTDDELRNVRRDAAIHFLRFREVYGDAFMEAISNIVGTGTYRSDSIKVYLDMPLHSYRDLVVFTRGGKAIAHDREYEEAHKNFLLLKSGGIKGGLFEPSYQTLEHMNEVDRSFVVRGKEILETK